MVLYGWVGAARRVRVGNDVSTTGPCSISSRCHQWISSPATAVRRRAIRVLSSVFAFSAIILILIGAQETKRLISNEPVVYFRCCGCDDKCCQNGPHNKGYSTRFIYRNDGRGYETRSAERMRAHLLVSKNCTPLEPLIVYPKEAGWGWWGPNDLVRYQNDMLRMKEEKQGKFR